MLKQDCPFDEHLRESGTLEDWSDAIKQFSPLILCTKAFSITQEGFWVILKSGKDSVVMRGAHFLSSPLFVSFCLSAFPSPVMCVGSPSGVQGKGVIRSVAAQVRRRQMAGNTQCLAEVEPKDRPRTHALRALPSLWATAGQLFRKH